MKEEQLYELVDRINSDLFYLYEECSSEEVKSALDKLKENKLLHHITAQVYRDVNGKGDYLDYYNGKRAEGIMTNEGIKFKYIKEV